jgi:DNA-binding transcriptional regulator LsrR (DeoR family)
MNKNPYLDRKRQEQYEKALALYKQGLTTREIGKALGKSHAWAALAIKKLTSKTKSKI